MKLKERKSSVSKATSTIPAYRSEASTSTVTISSESSQFSTSTKDSQTDHHPDIPYEINAPLPPIFSSSLVHKSKPFFFSRSHPNLATIRWLDITEEDIIQQEIEEIDMQNYDREIREYFEEAADKSRALREIFEEEGIRHLFEES